MRNVNKLTSKKSKKKKKKKKHGQSGSLCGAADDASALKNASREKSMHSAMLPPTASSQRDWIMQSVVGVNAKMGNRVHNATKSRTVFPSLD